MQNNLLDMSMDTIKFENVIEENDFDLNTAVEKFGQAVVWGTDWTAETINNQLVKGNIDLAPKFQRRDAWNDIEKSLFIESLILGIPVPPIILAENNNKKNSFIVIDGKQRLLSIRRFYQELRQNVSERESFEPLMLKDLKILKNLNNMYYKDVLEYNSEYITNIDNQSIRTIVIKNWQNEDFLYTVFLRLNTGSKKLSPQELRQALYPGKFLDFLDDKTSVSLEFQKLLNSKKPDPRMKDIELALRFFSYHYFIEDYNGNLKDFLDNSCKTINEKWDIIKDEIEILFHEIENVIRFSYKIMSPDRAFCRYKNGQPYNYFNRAIFEIFTYYFFRESLREKVLSNKELFVEKFKALNNNIEFSDAVNDTTKNINRLITRHNLFADIIKELPSCSNEKVNKLLLRENKIELL